MKPFKNGKFLAQWMMRITLVLFILVKFWPGFRTLHFADINFILSAIMIIFGTLLFVGGFLTKPSLTVLSTLIISLISIYLVIVNFSAGLHISFISPLMILSVALYFFTHGNKG